MENDPCMIASNIHVPNEYNYQITKHKQKKTELLSQVGKWGINKNNNSYRQWPTTYKEKEQAKPYSFRF